ncbi:HAD family hydrolase [Ruminiclostridium cellulolyticum]|uniref:HAD-superfamily hydrolase, subfamily IA, variant 3 n=1 Tax=Ruminiclostridium cellulolyticum (strain ATCC 35319 / DSM 5812 / JCM 6584 / H10) TaxID=394503 RepID=B8I409_RUMCH|nr:HAD family hydrolase [Ruminiclostridium cellulolyticum]ACL76442.1 HAD-superfamily hydrolase, subfamily IA, variant 3 [Ruminiclostridium cellulolyticum H10]
MKYTTVLFDLDGTLINSLEDLAESANEALTKHGFKAHPLEAYKKFVGNGVRNLIKSATPDGTEDSVVDMILEDYRKIYNKNYVNKTRVYAGIHEMLENLKKVGVKMGVCSNKPHKPTNEIVEKLLGNKYFDVVFGEREGIPRKPDPASLIEAAEKLGVVPSQTIYVGDSGGDMESANRAGMLAVGVLWGFREQDELKSCGGKILIASPSELVDFVTGDNRG